jgi:hypothetical protein
LVRCETPDEMKSKAKSTRPMMRTMSIETP